METQQIVMLVVLVLSFLLLISERLRNDVVGILIILALYVTGLLEAEDALSGFASEPAITVAGIFVLSGALHRTGLSDGIGAWIGRLAGGSLTRAISVIMPAVAALSAFSHHVTTTAIMLPVTMKLARDQNLPASKLLIPMSFAASLGTTITIIGAPAFIIASQVLRTYGGTGLSIFSIAPIGIALSLVGTVYMLTVGRALLPEHSGAEEQSDKFTLEHYFTELRILPGPRYIGKSVDQVESDGRHHMSIQGVIRRGRHLRNPIGKQEVCENDILLIRTNPGEIAAIRQEPGVELNPIAEFGGEGTVRDGELADISELLVQAVIAPGSELLGRTVGEMDFREKYGAIVVGLWRQEEWVDIPIARVRLRAGDVLVIEGDEEALARVAADPAFLIMTPFQGEARLRRKAPLAGLIMLGMILATAFNLLSIEMAALAGACAAVLTRCLSVAQAYRSIDTRIFVFIAGAIPLGAAMEKSGTSKLVAQWIQYGVEGWTPFWVLAVLFTIVAVLTQFMSDSATTALFAPVAVSLARALGHSPEAYVVTVAMASVASFLSPIGHHGNLIVYGPGGYRFRDFIVSGTPLTILAGLTVCALAPLLWGK